MPHGLDAGQRVWKQERRKEGWGEGGVPADVGEEEEQLSASAMHQLLFSLLACTFPFRFPP